MKDGYKTLKTPYFDKMDKECPWQDYPRPQFKRDSYISLNGSWDFAVTRDEEPPSEYEKKILVPFPPESLLSGLEEKIAPGDRLYYKRKFTLPKGFIKSRVILHVGAADQVCYTFINGSLLGAHEGGYIPYSYDITDYISDGENEIIFKVIDDMSPIYPLGKQSAHRGGMWYTPVSGIWQSVWLESIPDEAIEGIKITPSLTGAEISVIGGGKNKRLTLTATGEVFEFFSDKITVTPREAVLWTPENPYLYEFTLESAEDRIESYFALREIDIKTVDGMARICLNGKPYLFHGLLDQGYFPDGLFLPPTSDSYRDDIMTAKRLGFNTLRKHIKIEPLIFYHLCDKLGMIVFQDMINNSTYSFFRDTALPTVGLKRRSDKRLHKSSQSRDMFERVMYETADLLYNSPSVLYYTVFNEGWGQFCADEMYEKLKAHDSTRIIDATSGWFTQKKSDVDSRHVYFKKVKLGKRGDTPIVISEFGGYSYREEGHLFGKKNYGYKLFETKEELSAAVARLYEEEILPLIKEGVCALVYTQLTDVEDETNGLVTYDRCFTKVDYDKMSKIAEKLKAEI